MPRHTRPEPEPAGDSPGANLPVALREWTKHEGAPATRLRCCHCGQWLIIMDGARRVLKSNRVALGRPARWVETEQGRHLAMPEQDFDQPLARDAYVRCAKCSQFQKCAVDP